MRTRPAEMRSSSRTMIANGKTCDHLARFEMATLVYGKHLRMAKIPASSVGDSDGYGGLMFVISLES